MSFIIRIELASNIMADFNILHQSMTTRGFVQTIKGSDGAEYYLPRATYFISSTSDRSQILERSKQAVLQTGKIAEILVVEYVGCTWSGLKKVQK